jgi:hypothetical protein
VPGRHVAARPPPLPGGSSAVTADSGDACVVGPLLPGARVLGVTPSGAVTVVAAESHGSDALTLTYRDAAGLLGEATLFGEQLARLRLAEADSRWSFTADGADFRLAPKAVRIRMAGLFDPMLAVSSSNVEPLPHQIRAVYGELLPRTPLRFLLADDPGAGKTIMAGLYAKELALRGDLARCLIVAPGGLVEQWQDQLATKFACGSPASPRPRRRGRTSSTIIPC